MKKKISSRIKRTRYPGSNQKKQRIVNMYLSKMRGVRKQKAKKGVKPLDPDKIQVKPKIWKRK